MCVCVCVCVVQRKECGLLKASWHVKSFVKVTLSVYDENNFLLVLIYIYKGERVWGKLVAVDSL